MMLEFQILALDTSRRTRCGTALNLLHSLANNGRLWTDPELCKENICLKSGEITLNIVDQDPQASNTDVRGPRAFLVTLNGHFGEIEALREPLLEHIKHVEFDDRYVVKDRKCAARFSNSFHGYQNWAHLVEFERILRNE
jgi:hypothetical protein